MNKQTTQLYNLAVMARLGCESTLDNFPYLAGQKLISSTQDNDQECLWFWVDLGDKRGLNAEQAMFLKTNAAVFTHTIVPVG